MASPSVNIAINANIAGLQGDMKAAAGMVRGSAEQMAQAAATARNAWQQLAEVTIRNATEQRMLKAALDATSGSCEVSSTAIAALAEARKRAAVAAEQLATATKMATAAMQAETAAAAGAAGAEQVHARSMFEAQGAARLLGEEAGITLNRHLSRVLASSAMLGPVLEAAFPIAAAIGFFDVIQQGAEKLSELISDWVIYTQVMKDAYAAELVLNKQVADEREQQREQQKQLDRKIFEQTHTQAQVAAYDLKEEKKNLDALTASAVANLAKLKETFAAANQERNAPTRNPISGTVTGPPAGVDSQATENALNAAGREQTRLNALVDTSKKKYEELGNASKQAAADQADSARAAAEQAEHAQMQAWEQGLQGKKDAQDAFHALSKQDEANYWAGIYEQTKSGTENAKTAWHNMVEAQKAADVEQYEAHKEALEHQIAASRTGSQQRVQLEQTLTDYVRSVWGEQSKQYSEAVRKRIEADRQWKEEQKKATEEASQALDEYTRKMAELKDQGKQDQALGGLKTQEINVQGKAQLGLIGPKQEAAQLAAIHQQEIAEELAANQQKLQALADYIEKRRALLAKAGGAGSTDPEAQKLVQEIQKANLQVQELTNQRVKIEQKGDQQTLGDHLSILAISMQSYKQWAQQVSSTMFSGINSWIAHQKTFGQAMKQEWNSLAMDTIQAIERIGEKWIMEHVLMAAASKLFDIDSGQDSQAAKASAVNTAMASSDAAVAAAATLAYYSVFAPEIAPEMATAQYEEGLMFAAAATYDLGGVVPKTQVALVHGGERVLTPRQNNFFERLSSQSITDNRSTGGDTHVHLHQENQGLDGPSMSRVMRRNSKQMVKEFARAVRLGKAGSITG